MRQQAPVLGLDHVSVTTRDLDLVIIGSATFDAGGEGGEHVGELQPISAQPGVRLRQARECRTCQTGW
jgi:hypothetical protein